MSTFNILGVYSDNQGQTTIQIQDSHGYPYDLYCPTKAIAKILNDPNDDLDTAILQCRVTYADLGLI